MGICVRWRKKVWLAVIVLIGGLVLVACLGGGVPATLPGSPSARPTATTTFSIAPPTAPSASPVAPSTPLPTITPRLAPPTFTPLPTLPACYVPHPALWQITPPIESDWHRYNLQWESDSVVKYLIEEHHDCETGCCTATWARYVLAGATTTFTETVCPTSGEMTPFFASMQQIEVTEDDVTCSSTISPDGSRALIMVETAEPVPALKLGDWEYEAEEFYQGWIVYRNGSSPLPLFYTVEDMFRFQWAPDSHHLIIDAYCYGGEGILIQGIGLLVVDVDNLVTYTIADKYYGLCEGSISYQVAPDSRHLIYEPGIVATLDGSEQVRVCGEGREARSYTWSQDGQYAYVACFTSRAEPDTLSRYDTQTGENLILAGPDCGLTFKAIEMAVSPGQTHVAFVWGNTTFMPVEPYGVWMLDLTLVDDCR